MHFLSLLAVMAPLVAAIAFTDPDTNATLTKGSDYEVTWTSVDTDPDTFSIYLWNFVNWPPFYEALASDVEVSAGSYTVRIPCDVDSEYGYQFSGINGSNVYIIYAQSNKFSIGGADCTDPTTTSSTCAAAATVTVTVSGNSYANTTGSVTAAPTTSTAPRATSYGTCPDTIGWKSGYSEPVTLSSVPHGGQAKVTAAPTAVTAAAAVSTTATTIFESGVWVVYETVYKAIEDCGCTA